MADITVKNKKYGFYCVEQRPDSCGIVIFGASGDLTGRKILPSVFNLYLRDLLPEHFFILGTARTEMSDDTFRETVSAALEEINREKAAEFLPSVYYTACSYSIQSEYTALKERIAELDKKHGTGGNSVFYLATPPQLFHDISENIEKTGLTKETDPEHSYTRVILEKPFGRDLQSARRLNSELHDHIEEHQIYRIDHYLGKETVQNIMMLRFANAVFEPVWNRDYIDHIQITAAESIGVEHRAGYYDNSGCLRDMFQNHMMQMLTLAAMEPASSFDADRVRDEKIKTIRSIRPLCIDTLCDNVIRGQYRAGEMDGKKVKGYLEEEGIAPDSGTETFVAIKLLIDNWRWQDVPFYLRSGKRLGKKNTQITIQFKHVPHSMFSPFMPEELPANRLVLNVQPEEGFSLEIQAKHPGPKLCMSTLSMDFVYREAFGFDMPDAYERLLLDCMQGDQTLFVRSDALESAWELFTPLLEAWETNSSAGRLYPYPAGSWGPEEAHELLKRDKREWII